ncbi:unnamed protein product [Caenorhabditis nigoni]
MNSIIFKYTLLCFSIFLFIILLHHSDTISQTVLSLTYPIPSYYSTWHKCVQRQLLNTNETPETFWKNFVKRSRECDKKSNILENMRVIALKNQDEMKYAVLPIKKSSNNVFVTLGIGQDISAEEAFQKEMTKINQNVTFYGADPIVEGNSEKYSKIGKFFPFAIGANAGFSIASVLQDGLLIFKFFFPNLKLPGDYKDVSVVHVDIYYFLSEVLKENKIDYLWMDTEYAEYELFDIFYRNEKLSRMDIAFCQMSLEFSSTERIFNMNMTTMTPNGMKHPKMWQWYHVELNDVILFQEWKVQDSGTMIWSCFVVGFAGILLEFLKYSGWAVSEKILPAEKRTKYGGILVPSDSRFWTNHIIQSFYHFWQTLLAFILMNIYMTFNIYICLSVCLGLAIGHFFFGSRVH